MVNFILGGSKITANADCSHEIKDACSLEGRLKHLPAMWGTQVQFLCQNIPWRRKWQPTPVFSPGESQGQRSLEGYSPRGHKELDTTEATACTHACRAFEKCTPATQTVHISACVQSTCKSTSCTCIRATCNNSQ